jgi:hypothetical protein
MGSDIKENLRMETSMEKGLCGSKEASPRKLSGLKIE